MSTSPYFDVFLSHSSRDLEVVRAVAEQLRADGLRVWLDDWEIRPGDVIPAKIEEGLEHSRVLVLCMSGNAFGSDWAQLEAGTFRFRDPLNKDRRFVPLRLDDTPVRGSLAQFLYINWLPGYREQQYPKLLEACRPPEKSSAGPQREEPISQLYSPEAIRACVFSPDGRLALTCSDEKAMRIWDLNTGTCLQVLKGHRLPVWSIAWSSNQDQIISGSWDQEVRLWDVRDGKCLQVLSGHSALVSAVACSPEQRRALSGDTGGSLLLWDLDTGQYQRKFYSQRRIQVISFDPKGGRVLSGAEDGNLSLWDFVTDQSQTLAGHDGGVECVAWKSDGCHILSGSRDATLRLWDLKTGNCRRVFEGHTGAIRSVSWSTDFRHALSGSDDKTVRLWDVEEGRCLGVLDGHSAPIQVVAWSADQRHSWSEDAKGSVRMSDLSALVGNSEVPPVRLVDQLQYTNAKVLLVGESGSGKTALSRRLVLDEWQPSDSTVGAWATQWKLPVSPAGGIEREIWLWDFGGQADQRLIHQLYMEDTSLAVLVFDGQKEDLFETLGQWDRDLTRATRKTFNKILVAGRVDAGGLRVSRSQIETFVKQRNFSCFLETSAKANIGCQELKNAILDGIEWADIPWRSSPRLFRRLKDEILSLKDNGRVLMRFNELRDALRLRLTGEDVRFKDEELSAVVGLLAGPGVVWELEFGSWILLQPDRINAYAQAVIQTLREDKHERGAISEQQVLRGDLSYQSSSERLDGEEQRFVLLAMVQKLVERGLCLREHTENGPLLIFPSYYRRERPELVGHPAVLVSYRFNGFLDDIYATLVVRLHHTKPFQQDQLWRYAADFKTLTGKQLGVKLTRRSEGSGELEVYFDPAIPLEEKIIFSRYVHEHILQNGKDVVRLRYYVCPHCGTPVGNKEIAMRRLEEWMEKGATHHSATGRFKTWLNPPGNPTILCSECEERVNLWDEMEQRFASKEVQRRVQQLQDQSAFVLDNESKERALVGEVISTVALAGQISRELNVSDHGIDMEIEFKNDAGEVTGKKLYLQLKSGDSYLRTRRNDGTEIFEITKGRHVQYWMAQAFPVMLIIRNSDGEVRWMEVRDWLRRASKKGQEPVKRIVFDGLRFDVMSVRDWRQQILQQ